MTDIASINLSKEETTGIVKKIKSDHSGILSRILSSEKKNLKSKDSKVIPQEKNFEKKDF